MAKLRLEGSFVALITPFNRDGSIDFEAFRALIRFQRENRTRAILFMGSTGESSMLAPEEKKALIVQTAKMKPAGMHFFYGCTGNNTDSTIANLRFAKDNGADGAILAAPAYICAPEEDLVDFFIEVADAVELPLGIYNNPPRVKSDMHWDQLLRIFKHPNYVVHKESTTRVGQVAQLIAAKLEIGHDACGVAGRVVELARIGLGVLEEILERFRGHAWMDHQIKRVVAGERDRREIGHRIVGRLLPHCGNRRHWAVGGKQ